MKLGVIGLGRMGQIVVDRVLAAGHDVVAFDIEEDAVATAAEQGATGATSISELMNQLGEQKCIWLICSQHVHLVTNARDRQSRA